MNESQKENLRQALEDRLNQYAGIIETGKEDHRKCEVCETMRKIKEEPFHKLTRHELTCDYCPLNTVENYCVQRNPYRAQDFYIDPSFSRVDLVEHLEEMETLVKNWIDENELKEIVLRCTTEDKGRVRNEGI